MAAALCTSGYSSTESKQYVRTCSSSSSYSSSSLHLRASACVCLDAKGSLRPDASFVQGLSGYVRTIDFRAPGCALITTVCSSVLCSLVVFEVTKKRNVY